MSGKKKIIQLTGKGCWATLLTCLMMTATMVSTLPSCASKAGQVNQSGEDVFEKAETRAGEISRKKYPPPKSVTATS